MLDNCSILITCGPYESVNSHVICQSIDTMLSHTDIPTCAQRAGSGLSGRTRLLRAFLPTGGRGQFPGIRHSFHRFGVILTLSHSHF